MYKRNILSVVAIYDNYCQNISLVKKDLPWKILCLRINYLWYSLSCAFTHELNNYLRLSYIQWFLEVGIYSVEDYPPCSDPFIWNIKSASNNLTNSFQKMELIKIVYIMYIMDHNSSRNPNIFQHQSIDYFRFISYMGHLFLGVSFAWPAHCSVCNRRSFGPWVHCESLVQPPVHYVWQLYYQHPWL